MKIICIGSAAKDIFFPTDGGVILETPDDLLSQRKITFELGAKYQAENRYEALGGCAANAASGMAKLGLDASCYSKIGGDPLGEWIIKELKDKNVLTDLMQIEQRISSDLSAIVVDKKSGDRVIFFNRDANEKLKITPENLEGADWLFVSALNGNEKESWEDNLEKILKICAGKSKLAFNPGPENINNNPQKIREAIKHCEVLIVNKDEAIEIVSSIAGRDETLPRLYDDEKFLIGELKKIGAKIIAITDGKRGAWACDEKNIFYAEATGNNPVETTGAGDAFSSGFMAAVIKEKSLEEALKWGIANSGNAVKFYGAIEGLLDEGEILKEISKIVIKKL